MKSCQEWLLAFNQSYDNIMSHRAPGLNEYEISKVLTDAQENIVMGLYNGSLGKSFESHEDVSNFLAPLMRQAKMQVVTALGIQHTVSGSVIYELPANADEILFKTLELCTVKSDCKDSDGNYKYNEAIITPVTQDELWHTMRNPFKGANDNRVLRLTYPSKATTDENGNLSVKKYTELISKRDIGDYIVKYITRPEPIILVDLKERESDEGLTIHGKWQAQTCLLDEALHQAILAEAVRMAKAVWKS